MNRLTRGILKSLRLKENSPTRISPEQRALMWENVFGPGRSGTTEETALKISAFYRAIDIRAGAISKLPVSVRDLGRRVDLPDHRLTHLLTVRPNDAMTAADMKCAVEAQRLIRGNAYIWIVRDRDGTTRELIPLPVGCCHPIRAPDTGELWYLATNPKTREPFRLNPMEVEHHKGFTRDGLLGESLLSHASRTLEVSAARSRYEQSVYENGGHPSGVLTTETDLSRLQDIQTKDGEKTSYPDYIRREWERVHSGPDNAFRVAVLDNGLKYQPIAMSNSDAQFVESAAVTVEDIARFTGVPLNLLMTGKQSYNSNEANSLDFVKTTLQPSVVKYEEEDSFKLLTRSELQAKQWVTRNMMAELRGDSAARATWYRTMREVGLYSINDIAKIEDLPDVPGGDQRVASLNYVPLELFGLLSLLRKSGSAENMDPKELEQLLGKLRQIAGKF